MLTDQAPTTRPRTCLYCGCEITEPEGTNRRCDACLEAW